MKVLYIPHDSQMFGGANYALLEMISILKSKYGVNPIVLIPCDGKLKDKLDEINVEYIIFKYDWWAYTKSNNILKNLYRYMKLIINEFNERYKISSLCKVIDEKRIDIIHTNSSVINIGALLSNKTKIPHIWHVREFGEEHLNLRFLFGKKYSRRYMNKYSNTIILISDALLKKYYNIIRSKKLIRIYDGVSPEYDNHDYIKQNDGIFRAIVVGSIHRGKRQLESVEAVSSLIKEGYNIKLELIGKIADENYLCEINNYIEKNNLQAHIKYIGESNELNEIRRMSDVEIVSSYMEAFGRVTVEGMLSKLPIIASSSGANIELIKDGYNGYLYPLGNSKSLSAKIRILYDNPDGRLKMGNNGYVYAKNNFTSITNAQNVFELYKNIKLQRKYEVDKMNVGIITYHCAHNCGAMLQTYALQKSVSRLGYNAQIVDYRPLIITDGYKIKLRRSNNVIKNVGHFILTYKKQREKYNLFQDFEKDFLNLSNNKYISEYDIQNSEINCDALICGSDQIWNMDLNGQSKAYFLALDNYSGKRISYAASIGTNNIKPQYIKKVKQYVENLDYISLRENQGKNEIQKLTNKEVYQVLDPVFLLEEKEWELIDSNNFNIDYDYAIIYVMENNDLIEEVTKFISTQLNLKVICISSSLRKKDYIFKNLSNVGPKEFVNLIRKAKLVCTNSFHGTCLSIIFKKQFVTIAHSTLNSRIDSVLDIFDLKHHCIGGKIESVEEFNKIANFNLDKVDNILNVERNKSLEFLEKSLKN